jgi:hypothetical protein
MGNKLTITISGPVNSGQTELAGRISQLLEYLDIPVTFADPLKVEAANNTTLDNWQSELLDLSPEVHIIEEVILSDSYEVKRQRFFDHIKQSAKEVESWPDWKKGGLEYKQDSQDAPTTPLKLTSGNQILAELRKRKADRRDR